MICAYLSFLISYRNVFVLQTELKIPPFKLELACMFITGAINYLNNLGDIFWDTLYYVVPLFVLASQDQRSVAVKVGTNNAKFGLNLTPFD